MKEYDIFLPIWKNDGMRVDPNLLQTVRQELLAEFGGITSFPQPNLGFCKLGDITYHDEVIIYRVLAPESAKAREFFVGLKERLKAELGQHDLLIVERDVVAL
jgi:hypothetical protein